MSLFGTRARVREYCFADRPGNRVLVAMNVVHMTLNVIKVRLFPSCCPSRDAAHAPRQPNDFVQQASYVTVLENP